MGKVEGGHVPLAQVEQADHAHDVDGLHRHKAQHHADDLVAPGGGKRKNGGKQNNASLDAVTACLDGHAKIGRMVPQHLALGDGRFVEPCHQKRAYLGQHGRPRLHQMLLHPVEHVEAKQGELYAQKNKKESNHRDRLPSPGVGTLSISYIAAPRALPCPGTVAPRMQESTATAVLPCGQPCNRAFHPGQRRAPAACLAQQHLLGSKYSPESGLQCQYTC